MKTRLFKQLSFALVFLWLMVGVASATIQWTNNASSLIANVGGITSGSTSLTVTAGQGDRFPAVSSPHYYMMTIVDTSGNREIVKVTSRVALSNTMTIERAQEGTLSRSFAQGSLVELRVTKNALDHLSKAADINSNYYVADASAADQGATVNPNSLKSILDIIGGSKNVTIVCPHTGAGNTTTYTVSTDFTIPANVRMVVPKGSLLSVDSGKTVTINGTVGAGAYHIFTGSGTVSVTTYPSEDAWWGSPERLKVTALTVGGVNDPTVPVGAMNAYAGSSAPTGWLMCYGQTISRSTYATLFGVIGTTYGSGDGSTTFNLPDLRGRMLVGLDNMGGTAASRVAAATTLGGASGAETYNASHTHSVGSHTHTYAHTHTTPTTGLGGSTTVSSYLAKQAGTATFIWWTPESSYYNGAGAQVGNLTPGYYYVTPAMTTNSQSASTTSSSAGNTGAAGSATQSVMNPYMAVNYIIKY